MIPRSQRTGPAVSRPPAPGEIQNNPCALAQGSRVYSSPTPPHPRTSTAPRSAMTSGANAETWACLPRGVAQTRPVRRKPLSQLRRAAAALAPRPASLPKRSGPTWCQVALRPTPPIALGGAARAGPPAFGLHQPTGAWDAWVQVAQATLLKSGASWS